MFVITAQETLVAGHAIEQSSILRTKTQQKKRYMNLLQKDEMLKLDYLPSSREKQPTRLWK